MSRQGRRFVESTAGPFGVSRAMLYLALAW